MANVIQIQNNFLYLNGQRWSPKGVCYQPQDGVDPISDDKLSVIQGLVQGNWKTLGINAVRVYQVDPTLPHDQVMNYLAEHNIYVEVGAVNSQTSINSKNPQYTGAFLRRIKSVADAFAKYDNVLYFSISNEAINPADSPGYAIPSIIKAGARDLRAYMQQKGYRNVPIGCAERDAPMATIQAAAACMCGPANERIDILGYNCYRWSSPELQGNLDGYYLLYQQFTSLKASVIPVIMTEFGANNLNPRPFNDVPYLFGNQQVTSGNASVNMADLLSGGFVFRYEEDGNHFGLVDSNNNPTSFGGFDNLQKAYQAITGFSSGTPNTSTSLDCGAPGNNPYNLPLPPTPGGGGIPNDVSVTVTNQISPATSIILNCMVDGDWVPAITMSAGQAPTKATVPAGTSQVQVIFKATDTGEWYSACHVANVNTLKNGDTIGGTWEAPNGQGTCKIS